MQSTQPVDVPTPRTDAALFFCGDQTIGESVVSDGFARQLERELIAATAELERTKEQLRVANDCITSSISALQDARLGAGRQILRCYRAIFTQPQSGAVNPVKGEEA